MEMNNEEIEAMVIYQLSAISSFANTLNVEIENVRCHGAMYEKLNTDADFARSVALAVKKFNPWLNLIVGDPEIKEIIQKEEPVISKADKKEMSISNLYKVVIDAGHGGSDVGATREGIYEKDITLAIAKMVEKNLNNKGVKTTMTLEKDKTVSLQERCDISNETRPDLFVSVHVNSSVNNAIYGVETHWWKQDSVKYAETVHKHLGKNFNKWKTKDRGLFKSQFYVINHTEAPAILVEIGFISNENERAAISTQKRQTEIAKAISEGIMDYLKNKGSEE